jgi:hypothetical protein
MAWRHQNFIAALAVGYAYKKFRERTRCWKRLELVSGHRAHIRNIGYFGLKRITILP